MFFSYALYSQNKIFNNDAMSFLKQGQKPVYSDTVRRYMKENQQSVVILYHLQIDSIGNIHRYRSFPTYELSEELDTTLILPSIINSINKAISEWKFKDNLWKFRDENEAAKLNKHARFRPYAGWQWYFIFFHINSDILHNPIYLDVLNLRQ
jgi:hypothetical protein